MAGSIFLFFSSEKSLEMAVAAASVRRRWAVVNGGIWVVSHLYR
jgi:hypothetical protein